VTAASILQFACVGYLPNDEEEVSEAQQEVVVENALTQNALTQNALTQNALTQNALTQNALTQNALTQNALTQNALHDPNARELLKYVVSCALPEGVHFDIDVDGITYGYDGHIGLAPEWGLPDGSCDKQCKSWVSGCVMSRVDYLGETVLISIRGRHQALSSSLAERTAYPDREATYYGNIFSTPQDLYACLSPGATSIPRVCGPSLDDCVFDVLGECDELCGKPGNDGSFPNCRTGRGGDGKKHVGSVTVFLEP
jgi:hypothetical protein